MSKYKNKLNRLEYNKPSARMYQISYFEVLQEYKNNTKQKEYETSILKKISYIDSPEQFKKINITRFLKDEDKLIQLFKNGLFNIGFSASQKKYKLLSKDSEDIKSDFIFLDFDNKGKTSSQYGYASLYWIKVVLEKLDLNYIIKTSRNHSGNHERYHVFVPTLNTIKNRYEYMIYWETLVSEFRRYNIEVDEQTKNINRNIFSSNSETFKFVYRFDRKDLNYEIAEHQQEDIRKKQKLIESSRNSKNSLVLDNIALDLYSKQVNNMFGMIVNKNKSYSTSVQMHRDKNDKTAQVYGPLDNPYVIFDNGTGRREKAYNTLFSYLDYKNSVVVKQSLREQVQRNMENSLRHEFFEKKEKLKRYLITNEGLGKSSSIMNLAKDYNFIYATHTVSKLDEVESKLKELNINYNRIKTNEEVIKDFIRDTEEVTKLMSDYNVVLNDNKINKGYFISFAEYLMEYSSRVEFDGNIDAILHAIRSNNALINQDNVLIMTIAKLRVLMSMNVVNSKTKTIIFDEFPKNDWYKYTLENNYKKRKYFLSKKIRIILDELNILYKDIKYSEVEYSKILEKAISKVKNDSNNSVHNCLKKELFKIEEECKKHEEFSKFKLKWGGNQREIGVYYQDNFIDLLENEKVLILSTEKSLIEDILSQEGYKEFIDDKIEIYYDDDGNIVENDNIKFVLNGSLEDLENLKSVVYRFGNFEHRLLDEDITYALVSSTSKDILTPMVDKFKEYFEEENILDENSIIISNSLKNKFENVQTHLKIKGSNDYDECSSLIFGTLQKEEVLMQHLINSPKKQDRVRELSKAHKDREVDKEKYLKSLIEAEMQEVFMECEISQSIGRNSGFRNKGAKKVVVLPVLNQRSNNLVAKHLKLNYISPNVLRFDYDKKLNKLIKL